MAGILLTRFGTALLLTLLIELPTAFLLGQRGLRALTIVFLVNLLTNPAANLLYLATEIYISQIPSIMVQIPVEVLVTAVEASVYLQFSERRGDAIRHPVRLAICSNLISWGIGILLQL